MSCSRATSTPMLSSQCGLRAMLLGAMRFASGCQSACHGWRATWRASARSKRFSSARSTTGRSEHEGCCARASLAGHAAFLNSSPYTRFGYSSLLALRGLEIRVVQQVEGFFGFAQQLVLARSTAHRPLQQRLHAGGFRHRRASYFEEVHDASDLCERDIFCELQPRQHFLVADPAFTVAEMRAIEAESDRARWRRLRLVEPGELRLGIDEAADQPGAGEAVRPKRLARRPGASKQLFGGIQGS